MKKKVEGYQPQEKWDNRFIGYMPQEGFVRLPTVLMVLGISKSSFWNGVKTGKYPKAIKLGPRTSVWRVSDIRDLIAKIDEQ